MPDKDKAEQDAHNKGQEDYSDCGGQVDPNTITEFFHPSYDPPSGQKKAYDKGWDNAKDQDKK